MTLALCELFGITQLPKQLLAVFVKELNGWCKIDYFLEGLFFTRKVN